MQFTYEYNGQPVTLHLERRPDGTYRAVIGAQEYLFTAQALSEGRWLLTSGGQQQRVTAIAQGETRFVQHNGTLYTLTVADQRRPRRRATSGGGDLTAQMPGLVREARVVEGATVKAGDTLLVLEAMKMEIRVTATHDGVVQHVYVQAGDIVERGQRLAEVAPH
jgi:biotin carboxyl carrier protein